MKLLIITQRVDEQDSVLGFFVRWVEEFSKHCERVTVICLYKGEHHLPENVKVLSLGKEEGGSRFSKTFRYIVRFYKYIWSERKNYDSVFVHMNQEYVLLGGLFWRFFNKKISLWRNHKGGSALTRIAVMLSNSVFCTSEFSFTAKFKKTEIMPVGIDTDFFKPDISVHKKENSILFLGRIAPVKNVDVFIEVLKGLMYTRVEFSVTIAGSCANKDTEYEKMIRNKVREYSLDDNVTFTGAVSKNEARKLYREHEFYVNLTPSGSMDKTIIEAMACGTVPIVYNEGVKGILSEEFILSELNIDYVVDKINQAFAKKKIQNFRDDATLHSIKNLVSKVSKELI